MRTLATLLLPLLLAGCSAQLLEQAGDAAPPRPCSEPAKVFGSFSMQATRMAWSDARASTASTLELELAFTNEKSWPAALSNSGSGVLYALELRLRDKHGASHAPEQASGIVLVREPRKFREPPRPGPFGFVTPPKREDVRLDDSPDVNRPIKPGEIAEGRLVFNVPRGDYLFTIERKFADRKLASQPAEHFGACTISAADTAMLQTQGPIEARLPAAAPALA